MPRPLPACAVLPLPALLLALALSAAPAQSQIRRCVGADGTHLYTDRACADLDASERLPRPGDAGAFDRPIRRDCSRRLQDLVFELTAAIDARDVNRLAGVYHWPGISSRASHGLMDRLDRVAQDPVLDIVAVRAAEPVVATQRPGLSATFASTLQASPSVAPPPRVHGPPVALRVHQAVGQGAAPSRTMFGLRQNLGCWWITF